MIVVAAARAVADWEVRSSQFTHRLRARVPARKLDGTESTVDYRFMSGQCAGRNGERVRLNAAMPDFEARERCHFD